MGATGLDIGIESSKYEIYRFMLLVADGFLGLEVVCTSAYLAFDTLIIMWNEARVVGRYLKYPELQVFNNEPRMGLPKTLCQLLLYLYLQNSLSLLPPYTLSLREPPQSHSNRFG